MEHKQIEELFSWVNPTEEQITSTAYIRNVFEAVAHAMNEMLPDGREKSLMMTHLQDASMHAVKSALQSE